MKSSTRGNLLLELIAVSDRLGDGTQTRSLLIEHANEQLDELWNGADQGSIDPEAVDQEQLFAALDTLSKAEETEALSALIARLKALAEHDALDQRTRFEFRSIAVRASGRECCHNELRAAYDALIESGGPGLNPDDIHQINVEYATSLLERGNKAAYIAEVRERLDRISPGYQARVGVDKSGGTPENPKSSLFKRLSNRLQAEIRDTPVQGPEIDQQVNAANTLQSQGQNEAAFKAHMELAQQGVTASQMSIGTYYQLGMGCDVDYEAARKWYDLAADGGNNMAHLYLGALQQMGLGGPTDIKAAVEHYRAAAASGLATAYVNLSGLLANIGFRSVSDLPASCECVFRAWEIDPSTSLDTTLVYYASPLDQLTTA